MRQFIFLVLMVLCSVTGMAQQVFKTPSGEKYHTATCRYVKNVSEGLTVEAALERGLSPCSQCNPPTTARQGASSAGNGTLGIKSSEAKGTATAVQCKGKTKTGARCQRKTKNANGYCFQHEG
jgi:hypothetical protein